MRCLRREGGPVDLRAPWRGPVSYGMYENSGEMLARHVESRKSAKQYPSFPIHHPVPPDRAVPVFRVLFSAVLPGMFLSQIARDRDYGFTLINEDSISEAVTVG